MSKQSIEIPLREQITNTPSDKGMGLSSLSESTAESYGESGIKQLMPASSFSDQDTMSYYRVKSGNGVREHITGDCPDEWVQPA